MPTSRSTIEIARPLSAVYYQWTLMEAFPWFMAGVWDVVQLDRTRTLWSVSGAGVGREVEVEITDDSLDEHLSWESATGTPFGGSVTVERGSDAITLVHLELSWRHALTRARTADTLRFGDLSAARDLARFKALVEAFDPVEAPWRAEIARRASRWRPMPR